MKKYEIMDADNILEEGRGETGSVEGKEFISTKSFFAINIHPNTKTKNGGGRGRAKERNGVEKNH